MSKRRGVSHFHGIVITACPGAWSPVWGGRDLRPIIIDAEGIQPHVFVAEVIADLVEFLAEPAVRLWNKVRNKRPG